MSKKNLSVVLLDDEEKIIKLLEVLIPWQELSLHYAGNARNGIDGKKLVLEKKPDIIISDIKMPGIDGLALISQVHEQLPETEFIIVSGFSQFDYAKTAITYGVKNYLLKPVNRDELFDTLQKIVQEKQKAQSYLQLVQSEEERKTASMFLEVLQKGANEGGLALAMQNPVLSLIKIDSSDRILSADLENLLQEKILELLKRLFSVRVYCYSYAQFFFVLDATDGEAKGELKKLWANLRDLTHVFPQLKFFVFGTKVQGSLYAAGKRLEDSLCLRFLEQKSVFCDPAIPPQSQDGVQKLVDEWNKKAVQIFSLTAQVQEAAEGFLQECAAVAPELLQKVLLLAGRRVALLAEERGESGMDWFEGVFSRCISIAPDTQSLKSRFAQELAQFVQNCLQNQEKEGRRPIRLANAYISEHYSDYDISLETVAQQVGLTPSYFSALYKKESGGGFLEALTDVRINKAKELLQNTNDTIAKIAEAVGYADVKHFSKIFKKTTGIKPNEFREFYS